MEKVILFEYEIKTVATAFIPFLIAFFIFDRKYRDKGIMRSIYRHLWISAFAVYITSVFYFTNTGTFSDLLQNHWEIRIHQINIYPFTHTIDKLEYFENLLLFMPFGFMIPLVWERYRKLWKITVFGFSFSVLIECSQLLNNRRTDVDDLILNTLGTMIGYFICKLIIYKYDKITKTNPVEPLIYISVMFMSRFLLF